jgi:iron complex outermembrane receptor protein
MTMCETSKTGRSLALAAAVSTALLSAHVGAQGADAPVDVEEVIVTGSHIRGTPEDTAIPVEVITLEDMRDLGRPTNLDLVKLMSEVGQVAGEADRGNSFPIGAATVNLRNLGSRFTTVLFNGRRFPEQFSPVTGRFNNIAWIPNAAIGRVEVLKEGGAVTYGADAIAGVVNYMTRSGFEGLEVNADYRYIDDSDGDYSADALWGTRFEDGGNALVSVAYQHRSRLRALDRDWADRDYLENPEGWSSSGAPGSYLFQGSTLTGTTRTFFPITALGATPTSRYVGGRQMSVTGIVRDPQCEALGGFAGWSSTPSPVCYFRTNQYQNLVEESNSYQLYAEINNNLGETVKWHNEFLYYQLDLPDIPTAPGDLPLSWPLASGSTGRQLAGTSPTYFTAGSNPAVAHLLGTLTNLDGTTAFTPAQIAAITSAGRAAMVFGTWRPFGAGGNPVFGEHDVQRNNTKLWRVTTELSGALPKFLGTELTWQVALTYNRVVDRRDVNDMSVNRLQSALNGFGGPNCTGSTPGANGCGYLNPFSSAIERNIYTGQLNPGFVGTGSFAGYMPGQGLRNDPQLVRWLYERIWLERTYDYAIFDPLITGTTGWDLPGGPVAIAFGGQFRWTREVTELDDLSNRDLNPCPTPGVTNCNEDSRTGPLAFTRPTTVMGATQETRRRFPVAAAFFEAQLPLWDTIDMQVAGRYEKFYSDLTEKDNAEFVPAASIKWQALPWLALRASGGKTFTQVNPPKDNGPIVQTSLPNADFGGIGGSTNSYTTANFDNVDVESEKGKYLDVGFLLQAGNFSATVDYFDIRVEDFARTLQVAGVVSALALPGEPRAVNTLINCSSALFNAQPGLGGRPFVELNGPCVQGQSRLDSVSAGGSPGGLPGGRINYFGGSRETNAGELITSGIDLSASYRFENFGGGMFTPSLDVSYILEWELSDHVVAGVPISPGYDGVGFRNEETGRIGQAVPEWRASLGLNWRRNGHTLNLIARFIPSVKDEDEQQFASLPAHNANIGSDNGTTTTGTGAATVCSTVFPGLASDLDNPPLSAGSGDFGAGSTGLTGVIGSGTRGFCGAQNTRVLSGQKIKSMFNLDLTYRVELPWETDVSFSIYNLLNEEPSFTRDGVTYHSGFGSPLERNFKMTLSKRF